MQMSHKPLQVLRKLQGRLPSTMFERQPLDLFTETNDVIEGHVVCFMFFIVLVLITFLFFFLNQLTILDRNLAPSSMNAKTVIQSNVVRFLRIVFWMACADVFSASLILCVHGPQL
jgi:hypothetical protein